MLAGQSIYSIAQRWNREGILTPKGNAWRSSNLRHVLTRPRNAAIHTYNGEETGHAATWQPIVSEDIYRATVRLLSDSSRNSGGGGRRKGLLTGVVRCAKCGSRVLQGNSRANRDGERYRIYTCRKGRCITMPADWLESYVLRQVIDHAEQWAAHASPSEDGEAESTALRAEESVLLQRKSDLAEMFAEGTIDKTGLAAGTASITSRLAEIADRLADIAKARVGIDLADLEYLWQVVTDMETEKLRAIIETVTESIALLPRGKGTRLPKGEHVEITWRKGGATDEGEHLAAVLAFSDAV